MKIEKKSEKSSSTTIILFIVFTLWLLYSYLTFQTPTSSAMMRYGLSSSELNLLRLSIVIPVLVIWGVIAYSASKVYEYAGTIAGSLDGEGFALLARGFYLFLASSIVSSFISLVIQFNSVPTPSPLAQNLRIISTYSTLTFSFFGYLFVYVGSRKFIALTKTEKLAKKQNMYGYFIIAIATAIYAYLVFNNPLRTISTNPAIPPTYGVSDPLIILTIMLPTVLTWLFGILAISNLVIFRKHTQGVIYKKALSKFYTGFILVVSLVIVLNFITQFSTYWSTAGLGSVLVFVYVILGVILLGYTYIAAGSHKLKQLELV